MEFLVFIRVAIADALEVGLVLLHGLDFKVDSRLLVEQNLVLLFLLIDLFLEYLNLVVLIRPLLVRLTLLLLVVLEELRELDHLVLKLEVSRPEVALLLAELILLPMLLITPIRKVEILTT